MTRHSTAKSLSTNSPAKEVASEWRSSRVGLGFGAMRAGRDSHGGRSNRDVAVFGKRRSVDDCLADATMPDGVTAAAVSAARSVPNKHLSRAQFIAVRTMSWCLGDPLPATPNQISNGHAAHCAPTVSCSFDGLMNGQSVHGGTTSRVSGLASSRCHCTTPRRACASQRRLG